MSRVQDKVFTWAQYDRIVEQEENNGQVAGKIVVKDSIADIFLQQILTRPREFDVVATMNLNGDYFSDALAAQVGGIGIALEANQQLCNRTCYFRSNSWYCSKISGLDKVNPSSVILSFVLMLEHMGWTGQ